MTQATVTTGPAARAVGAKKYYGDGDTEVRAIDAWRGSLANSAWMRSEPVGVMQVTVIGSVGYRCSKARIIGAAAMLSPTDTACTQRPPGFIAGSAREKRSPMRFAYAGALRARSQSRIATNGSPR